MLVVLVLFVVDVTCLEGSGPRLRSAQVGLLDFHMVAELFVYLLCVQVLSDSFNRDVCCLTLFARGSFWYKCPCILVWKKKSAPQRAVIAVFLVELVGLKAL